jgi:hypothetical protein
MAVRVRGWLVKACAASVFAGSCAGCAAQPASPDRDGARARPVVWQQSCEQVASVPEANALAAARGAAGWELVALYNGVLCFKRPLPDGGPGAFRGPASGPVPSVQDPGF